MSSPVLSNKEHLNRMHWNVYLYSSIKLLLGECNESWNVCEKQKEAPTLCVITVHALQGQIMIQTGEFVECKITNCMQELHAAVHDRVLCHITPFLL